MQFWEVCPEQGEFRGRAPRGIRKARLRRCHLSLILKEKLELEDGRGWMCGKRPGRGNSGFKGTSVHHGCILYGWSAGVSWFFCLFIVIIVQGGYWWLMGEEAEIRLWRVLLPCHGERKLPGALTVCHASFLLWVLNTRLLIILYSSLAFLILLKDSYFKKVI